MFAAQVAQARDRLAGRLAAQVGSDGAVQGWCASRVLESVLVLTLLRQEHQYPDVQNALIRYLHAQRPAAGSFDELLVRAAVTGERRRSQETLIWLDEFEHFTTSRKRLMFHAILAVLGIVPHDEHLDPSRIYYTGFTSWVNLTLCALKILHAFGLGRDELVTDTDRAFLTGQLETGSSHEIREGHLLSHVLGLMAVRRCEPCGARVRDGIDKLVRHRNPDGGFPFIAGLEIFCTVTAGLALAGTEHRALERIANYLAAMQRPDGGWAYAEQVRQTDTDDTAYCTQFLRAAAPLRHARTIRAAERYLTDIANVDGGFPTFRKGHRSESTMTSGALRALAPAWQDHSRLCETATKYLLDAQEPAGTFERSWSLSESNAIFRTISALSAVPRGQAGHLRDRIGWVMARSMRYLQATQNHDGGWGQRSGDPSDVISTSYALLVMPGNGDGARYLLSQQRHDAGFISVPDQAGPRPLPYDVPVLADIFALWALDRVTAHNSGRSRGGG
ncbi:MAG: prenyltransferase/squalene oxidase repeat-containing protein [Pseudonocardiaceae bacterium]